MTIAHAMDAVLNPPPKHFHEYDLRYFRRVYLSDTFDGASNPSEGTAFSAILYGTHVIHSRRKDYLNGEGGYSHEEGDTRAFSMWLASRLYLEIVDIARTIYFGGTPASQGVGSKDGDCVYASAGVRMLRRHPQFRVMAKDFGLTLKRLRGRRKGQYRVIVTARHTELARAA